MEQIQPLSITRTVSSLLLMLSLVVLAILFALMIWEILWVEVCKRRRDDNWRNRVIDRLVPWWFAAALACVAAAIAIPLEYYPVADHWLHAQVSLWGPGAYVVAMYAAGCLWTVDLTRLGIRGLDWLTSQKPWDACEPRGKEWS